MTRAERTLLRCELILEDFQIVNIELFEDAVWHNYEKQLHLYLLLRTFCNSAGYFNLGEAIRFISKRIRVSQRTVRDHLIRNERSLLNLNLIEYDGKNYKIVGITRVLKERGYHSLQSVVLMNRTLFFKPRAFIALCVAVVKRDFLGTQFYLRHGKAKTVIDVRSKTKVKLSKLEQTYSDHCGNRKPYFGECSLRLASNLTGKSISTLHRYKKISEYLGFEKYFRNYDPEFDKLKIRTFGQLLDLLSTLDDMEGYDLKRFVYDTTFKIYRKIDADQILSYIPVFKRNRLGGVKP